ncbi:hypothetical protein C8R46DRAFT_1060108 [Mycena filopes]|nr:hypothetical protein C8R46DRAFT_1060108 [Mycena filopes]
MPVSRIPYRQSRRLRRADPKDNQDDDLWETYDETLLTVKSEPDAAPPLLDAPAPVIHDMSSPEPAQHIPRPRNAFICFRSDYVKAQKNAAANSKPKALDQTAMSCGAGDAWRKMDEGEREPYVLMALAEKAAHALKYPDYRYAPGSATGVARKVRKPKARRASTVTSDASDEPMRPTSPAVSKPRPSRKYETNPPASRPTSRRKSNAVAPRSRRTPPSPAPAPAPVSILPPIEPTPDVPEVPEAPAPAPVTPLESAPDVPEAPEPVPAPATYEDSNDKISIDKSPVRPSGYDRPPTHFGFKRALSPTVVEALTLPCPASPATQNDAFSSRAPSPSPSPSPSPAVEWDGWLYTPLELPEEEELHFGAPLEAFGFYHPWNLDSDLSDPGVLAEI